MIQSNICSVSVIIPFYNASTSISHTLISVFNQTLLPSEIIIVDDGSNKVEQDLLKTIVSDFNGNSALQVKIQLFSLDNNEGASHARNVAIEKSTMKYLAFLDADDAWAENKIELQYSFMEDHDFHITGHGYVHNLNNDEFVVEEFNYNKIKKYQFIYANHFYTPTVMALRANFQLFDTNFQRTEDYKCWVENICVGGAVIIRNKLAGGFKNPLGESGLSGSINKMHQGQLDVLKSLHEEKVISFPFYCAAFLVEYIKYPLRIIRIKMDL
ncbi:glycosyltransferase family 2 protein [Psychromonas antarctica]|uniref:glycosyltransferase family 2 protein n=1 Tax=Psychromonas antarctica TaxID=67573 RepID=UPI001EE95888|nr:glycosyltransferase family 2 protein [Psychromonas antarctica]MCG6202514.1 glycosyltransferase [Psychromonas antarctica]